MNYTWSNTFWIKLRSWEYWPWQLIYLPVFAYYLWLSIKSGSPFFFFNANPGIESGGLLIESKKKILDLIPNKWIPRTLYFEHPSSCEEVLQEMRSASLYFPVIAKPDYGERGWGVEKIEDPNELEMYMRKSRINVLIQEFIPYPVELGIFYIREPGNNMGRISSIVKKLLLHVEGDGSTNVKNLIKRDPRALIQLKNLEHRHPGLMNLVPGKGEKIELVPIANHSRGATFMDGCDLINPRLNEVINSIALEIDGFFYGRFDIRCRSIEDLNHGINFRILELNGAKSEPAHIYQPGFSIRLAYKTLFFHWKEMYRIAIINRQEGIPFPSFREGWRVWKKYLQYSKLRKK